MSKTAIALTVAGSDSSGGAGIQADLKTFSALGVYGASAITALTAQNTLGVQDILYVDPVFVAEQIKSVFEDTKPHSVKIGMLANKKIIETVGNSLSQFNAQNIVLDPVMIATSGDRLLRDDAVQSLIERLFSLACVITPNLQEAAALLNVDIAENVDEMEKQAQTLINLGANAVLIKGGHLSFNSIMSDQSTDILVSPLCVRHYTTQRINTMNTHGTGCTLSSAIAAHLAHGLELESAINEAKIYVTGAIKAADSLNIGKGNGPTHHFYKWW